MKGNRNHTVLIAIFILLLTGKNLGVIELIEN